MLNVSPLSPFVLTIFFPISTTMLLILPLRSSPLFKAFSTRYIAATYRYGRWASTANITSTSTPNNPNPQDGNRPFQILGVQQIAIGSETRQPLQDIWQNIFGLQPHSTHRLERENVEEDIISLGPEPFAVEIDLMIPLDPEKSPKVNVEKEGRLLCYVMMCCLL
jgi:hypothetical protein